MTDIKLTEEQRQRIKEFANATALKMSWEISNYIENEVLRSVDFSLESNELAGEGVPTPAPESAPDAIPEPMPTPDPIQTPEVPLDLSEISVPTPDTLTPPDFTIPASEIAPPAEQSQSVFDAEPTPPSLDSLDGSDLNYTPPTEAPRPAELPADLPVDLSTDSPADFSVPAPAPETAPIQGAPELTPVTDDAATYVPPEVELPSESSADTETLPELDLPVPAPTPEIAPLVDETAQNEPLPSASEQNTAPSDGSFSKGHNLLSKVMSKGWGKKNQ